MKHASFLILAIGLCGLSFAACAEGDSTTFGNQPSGGGNGDGGNGQGGSAGGGIGGKGGMGNTGSGSSGGSTSSSSASSASSTGISSGNTCSFQCTSDADCVNNCPVPSAGVNCCSTSTKTCYVSGSTMCPGSSGGSSGGMYP